MKYIKQVANALLLIVFVGLIAAPYGAFRLLRVEKKDALGATLSAISKREHEGFFSTSLPNPNTLMREVFFTVFSGILQNQWIKPAQSVPTPKSLYR